MESQPYATGNTATESTERKGFMGQDEVDYFGDIKIKINTLLWEVLPMKATMEEAEKAAVLLWDEVVRLREKHGGKGMGT